MSFRLMNSLTLEKSYFGKNQKKYSQMISSQNNEFQNFGFLYSLPTVLPSIWSIL